MRKFKSAFTMIELVLVIVVAGILAAVAIPRWNRNVMPELLDQVAADIRYTQQLAINDNKFNAADSTWYQNLYKISFAKVGNDWAYSIFSNEKNANGATNTLANLAKDPHNQNKFLAANLTNATQNNKKLNITKTYGVSDINFDGCANGRVSYSRISFDSYGRPFGNVDTTNNLYSNSIRQNCIIVFTVNGETGSIVIAPETGYVSVIY